jgi:hypothetical protein
VAFKQIPDTHYLLKAAKKHLAIAINNAKQYESTWHSIIWINSNTQTKRRVLEELNHLAFDCYTHFLIAVDYLNEYALLMNEQGKTTAKWWSEVSINLSLAHTSIHRENEREISARQLRLFLN